MEGYALPARHSLRFCFTFDSIDSTESYVNESSSDTLRRAPYPCGRGLEGHTLPCGLPKYFSL